MTEPSGTPRRLTHDTRKPTLDRSRDAAPAEGLRALDLVETAMLLALHRSTSERAPLTPCLALTLEVAFLLQKRGIIAVCDEIDATGQAPPHRAIYDPLAWRYRWPIATAAGFGDELQSRVRMLARDVASLPAKHMLWQILASAEVEGYLSHLLRRHGFDPQWAIDARDQGRWARGLSLAQMRYVVWASVREGAASYLRSAGDAEQARDAIIMELGRRTKWIEARPGMGNEFLPAPNTRQSILLSVFLDDLAPVGQQYWLSAPSEAVLRERPP